VLLEQLGLRRRLVLCRRHGLTEFGGIEKRTPRHPSAKRIACSRTLSSEAAYWAIGSVNIAPTNRQYVREVYIVELQREKLALRYGRGKLGKFPHGKRIPSIPTTE
jgi:hypothetical protein